MGFHQLKNIKKRSDLKKEIKKNAELKRLLT